MLPRGFTRKTRAPLFGSCDLGASSDVDASVQGSYRGEEREMTSAGTCSHPFCQAQEMRKGWDKVRVEYSFS